MLLLGFVEYYELPAMSTPAVRIRTTTLPVLHGRDYLRRECSNQWTSTLTLYHMGRDFVSS